MNSIIKFLNYISLSLPVLYASNTSTKDFCKISIDEIENHQLDEIFYVVNDGGTKDNEITHFNAFFVDFDCPKLENGNYAPLDDVRNFKEAVLKKIASFCLFPTFIIDTRNGYHIYWCLEQDNDIKREEWQIIEKQFVSIFDADPKVCNPARKMRVPFTYWNKDITSPYYVSIYMFNDLHYSISTIKSALTVSTKANDMFAKSQLSGKLTSTVNSENIKAIQNLDVSAMKTILKNKNEIGLDKANLNICELYSKINLSSFIGDDSAMFRCILPNHTDNVPSAKIFITENGIQLYKCFGCESVLNITQLVQRLANCSFEQSLDFLSKVYNITITELEKIHHNTELLKRNINFLISNNFQAMYPYTYKLIRRRIPHLIDILQIAIENINSYNETEGYPIFWTSYSHILSKSGNFKSKNRISNTLTLLSLLGIVKKLDDSKIPSHLLQKAREVANMHNYCKRCNYYMVKPLNNNTLIEIEEKAKELGEKNITTSSLNIEFILRSFSKEVAKETYPQHRHILYTSKISDEKTTGLVKTIFDNINSRNYVLERDLPNKNQWKKSINEILDSYDLKRIKLNKNLKEALRIPINGYPFIICKNDILEQGEDGKWRICSQNIQI